MYHTARALIIQPASQNTTIDESALSQLANFGIVCEIVKAGSKVDFSNIDILPDVIILDATHADAYCKMADYAKALLSHKTLDILPIVMVGPSHEFKNFPVALHLDEKQPAEVIAKKLRHIIRLTAMKLEYGRRLETAKQFNIRAKALDFNEQNTNYRLLVVGKGERYFKLATLYQGTAILKTAKSLQEAENLMQKTAFDCLIIDTLVDKKFEIDDLKALKLNARHFSLPVLLLQEGLPKELQTELVETGICDLFDLTDKTDELAIYSKTLINAEKIRQSLISAFKDPVFEKITDSKTSLPAKRFFEAHLDRLIAQSQAWNTPIAFGLMTIDVSFQTNKEADSKRRAKILRQIGQMIGSLIRSEDIATYFGEGKFVLACPNTSAMTISILISRIQAVLSSTEFSSGGEPSKINVNTSYFESDPKDTQSKILKSLIET